MTDTSGEETSGHQQSLEQERNRILQEYQSTNEALEDLKKASEALNETLESLQERRIQADSLCDDINAVKQKYEELRDNAQTTRDELTNKQDEVSAKISEINSAYDHVEQQRKVLLEDHTDEQGKLIKGIITQIHETNSACKILLSETEQNATGIKERLENELKTAMECLEELKERSKIDFSDFKETSQAELQELKKALESEIRSLLPEAGAAGLSSTYFEAKSKYSITRTHINSKGWRKLIAQGYHYISSIIPSLLFYVMFLFPLGFIVWMFADLMPTIKDLLNTAKNITNGQSSAISVYTANKEYIQDILLMRVLISLPLATISLFGWSSIRLYRRLYEEYNHKQRVMQLYHSFKKELDEHGSEEQKQALLTVMLTTVGDKPSLAMNKYDQGMEGLLSGCGIRKASSKESKKDP